MMNAFTISYDLAGLFYRIGIHLASPFHAKAKEWISGRKGWKARFALYSEKKCLIWVHVASLGEYELSLPLIESLKRNHPESFLLVTFFSPSGFLYRKDNPYIDAYEYLPYDTSGNARIVIDLIQPKLALFAKYDLWFHYLKYLQSKNIPTIVFSGTFRASQVYFKWFAKPYLDVIKNIHHFFVTDSLSTEVLKQNGMSQFTLVGDSRFEKVFQNAQTNISLPEIEEFLDGENCIIVGSAWKEDIEVIMPLLNDRSFPYKVIIAPHELKENIFSFIEKNYKKESIRYSRIKDNCSSCAQLLIIDNIGMLSRLYYYGTIAFVGGGFKHGLHNILEPLSFGLPTFFGPNINKYPEALDAVRLGGGFAVKDAKELQNFFFRIINDKAQYNKILAHNRTWVKSKANVSQKIVQYIESTIPYFKTND